MPIALCIECGCRDDAACVDEVTDEACRWLEVDYAAGVGVCSSCPAAVERWNAGDRQLAVHLPKCKRFGCPTCGSESGTSCFRPRLGVPWQFLRYAPHAERCRAAALQRQDEAVVHP